MKSVIDWLMPKRSSCLSTYLVVCFFSSSAFSASVALLSPNARDQIEQEQAERLKNIESSEQDIERLNTFEPLPELPSQDSHQCFEIKEIEFKGSTLFSSEELLELIEFVPSCLSITDINEYLRVITNEYISLGYVTSRAFLAPQDLSDGVLELIIIEGQVEKGMLNGKEQGAITQAYPVKAGDLLNLRDIEQALDQINRLQRYNAQIQIVPSEQQGFSVVEIKSTEGKPWFVSVGYNNGGSENTGEQQVSGYFETGDLLNLLEKWTLSGSKSAESSDLFDSESLNFSLDIPYGYWNASYRSSYSSYLTSFEHNGFLIDSSGRTNTHNVGLNYLLFRDNKSKAKITTTLSHRRDKNFMMGSLIEASSRNLSHGMAGMEYSSRIGSGFITLYPQLFWGTDWFGGEESLSNDDRLPQAEFFKGALTTSYSTQLVSSLGYRTTLFGQWSNDTLYGSQRISIGGQYSVRGFKNASISGDQGYYWRNELSYSFGQVGIIGDVRLELAIDTGAIVKDKHDQYEQGSLIGSALAIKTRNKYVSTQLSIGAPIDHPDRLNPDDYSLNYTIDISF
ncbi:ShlB/FhaC/HecB family hemolysin secretion/activation protein [Vibrio sp. LaRot3]|uniref:ShlB/FhaC/HecB family hemolysin secretion/activation protein n=1 Tax=Vibrio sp. LaRot3 TaxID=2998829 RepID=UPI0022CDD3C6|nr:ShlB/FhaC/HecB family hemolysin secretion/activation protein [Vibrio sp. LaRot3]MDA0147407.1 ShlB/FhaC/HecB family hemolysin secretion/activation protein [Vibrio sp. LaRot3]